SSHDVTAFDHPCSFFFVDSCVDLRLLHSFPTRRSSDLFPPLWARIRFESATFCRAHLNALATAKAGRGLANPRSGFGSSEGVERSEEHTSELQSRFDLVCRLLLEKKN